MHTGTQTDIHTHTYTNGHTHAYTNGHTHACTNGHTHACTNGHTRARRYTNAHTHAHTYTHAHTHFMYDDDRRLINNFWTQIRSFKSFKNNNAMIKIWNLDHATQEWGMVMSK